MVENKNNECFPIREANGEARRKYIIPTSLQHFLGLTSEDLDTFMFESIVVCRTYDYAYDDENLNLFSSTLKDATLC